MPDEAPVSRSLSLGGPVDEHRGARVCHAQRGQNGALDWPGKPAGPGVVNPPTSNRSMNHPRRHVLGQALAATSALLAAPLFAAAPLSSGTASPRLRR